VTGLLSFDDEGDSTTAPQVFTFEKGNMEIADNVGPDKGDG
jgi:hypothetical protein